MTKVWLLIRNWKNQNMKFQIRKYLPSILFFIVFEAIAITLWLTKNNLFYLFNFSYIGCFISLGFFCLLAITNTQEGLFNCLSVVICSFISVCVDITDNARNRENGTECILCMECVKNCPKNALQFQKNKCNAALHVCHNKILVLFVAALYYKVAKANNHKIWRNKL